MIYIPKRIVQTWKNDNIPDHWKPSPKSIKRLMPHWNYILYDDDMAESLVKKYFPDFYDTYMNLEYTIMKVDSFRYCYLYLYGGIYMDLDIELTKSLDNLFNDDFDLYLVKSGNITSVYTNSFMASKPKCSFWLKCLDEIKKPYPYWAYGKHLKTMTKTGPLMLSRMVNKYKYDYSIKNIDSKFIMPCSSCENLPCTKPGAYTRALKGSSWCGWDSYLFVTCSCNWGKILFIIFIILMLFYLV